MGRTLELTGQAKSRQQRLIQVLEPYNLTAASQLARKIGMHATTILKIVSHGNMSPMVENAIKVKFPAINMKYVLNGSGEPFNQAAIKETAQMISDIGEKNALKFKPVPYLSSEAIESNMSVVAEPLMQHISWHESSASTNGATVIIDVVNDEMHPLFSKNQRIGIRLLTSHKIIQWGKPYCILAAGNLFCRYIFKDHTNDLKVILRAANSHYEDMHVYMSDIERLWLVIAKDERIDY